LNSLELITTFVVEKHGRPIKTQRDTSWFHLKAAMMMVGLAPEGFQKTATGGNFRNKPNLNNRKDDRMEWKIILNDEYQYIEVITSGIADKDGSLNMAKEIMKTMRANRLKKVLIDHRNIVSVAGNTTDIFNRPKLLKFIGVILKIRIAEIIKPEHLKHFKFFETVCVNQGYQISIFQDKNDALSWLLE
jgi:hypothetical protein